MRLWGVFVFHIRTRSNPVGSAEDDWRSLQFAKGKPRDVGSDRVGEAATLHRLGDDDKATGATHRRQNRIIVEGHQSAGVYDLGLDPVTGKIGSGVHRRVK